MNNAVSLQPVQEVFPALIRARKLLCDASTALAWADEPSNVCWNEENPQRALMLAQEAVLVLERHIIDHS